MENNITLDKKPVVSVGIPTYNRPEGLKRTIECITRQTYKYLEIIVSDNCSTDPAVEIIVKEFQKQDNRIQYFRQNKNIGPFNNFKFVLEKATCEYFMWAADDDWIDHFYIEKCLNFLISNKEYVLVGGKAKYFNNKESNLGFYCINLLQASGYQRVINYFNLLMENNRNTIFYGIFNRGYLIKIPFKNVLGLDWIIVAATSFKGKVKTLEDVCINSSVESASEGAKNISKLFWYSVAFNIFIDILTSPIYKEIYIFKKLTLSLKCFSIIYMNYVIRQKFLYVIIQKIKNKLIHKLKYLLI